MEREKTLMEYSFPRYLAAKKTVDDCALNQRVWGALEDRLKQGQQSSSLTVLEVGAGIGTMIERALERGLISNALYDAIDSQANNIESARAHLSSWADGHGWWTGPAAGGLDLHKGEKTVRVRLETMDIFDFLKTHPNQPTWDLLIANAFLDLFDIPQILPGLRRCLKPDGLAYFSINFDGVTAFEPVFDRELEKRIVSAYHRTMDERLTGGMPSGDSHAGRHLFQELVHAGFQILEAGSSDWIVYPRNGVYPADEAYFLHHILHFFEESLQRRSEVTSGELESWLKRRHAEVERGELVYIAHQIDFLAGAPETG
jgi:SAM-dependent methyltransferase